MPMSSKGLDFIKKYEKLTLNLTKNRQVTRPWATVTKSCLAKGDSAEEVATAVQLRRAFGGQRHHQPEGRQPTPANSGCCVQQAESSKFAILTAEQSALRLRSWAVRAGDLGVGEGGPARARLTSWRSNCSWTAVGPSGFTITVSFSAQKPPDFETDLPRG